MLYMGRIFILLRQKKLVNNDDNLMIILQLSMLTWGGNFDNLLELVNLHDHSTYETQMQALIFFQKLLILGEAFETKLFFRGYL